MAKLFIHLGPQLPNEIPNPPFRGFICFDTMNKKANGRRKLMLFHKNKKVGYVIFRWSKAVQRVSDGRVYRKAKGSLNNITVDQEFSQEALVKMVRRAMEKAGWKFYLFRPINPDSYSSGKFVSWIKWQL